MIRRRSRSGLRAICTFCILLGFFGIIYTLPRNVRADNRQTWFDLAAQPSLEKSWSIPASQFSTAVTQGYNPPCKTFELYKNYLSQSLPLWRQQVSGCWYATPLGLIMHNGNYAAESGSIIAGNTIYPNHNSNDVSLKPTPREGLFLEQRNHQNNTKRYLKFHYGAKLFTNYSLVGSATHSLTADDTFTLKNSIGQNVWLDGRGMNYSKNGKWAVGATTNYALFRINLETKKIINFGKPIQSGSGWNPFMTVSITNDGQYAVATGTAGTGEQWMRIYNLDECDGDEQYVVTVHQANCTYRDVTEFVRQNIPGFYRFTMAEFGNNDTLVFYHYNVSGDKAYTRYVMSAPHAEPRAKNYIALGDSFASGEGAYAYFKGTDEGADQNNCHLSKLSYPYLLGEWLKIDSYHSVACSGARTRNVIGPELIDTSLGDDTKHSRTNQYLRDIPKNELGGWLPGFNLQKEYIEDHNPDTITISMIGNDIGFGKKIQRCLGPDTCYGTYEDRLELLREVYGKFDMLTNLYQELKSTADVNAKIYVVGYPAIGKSGGDCAVNIRLNADELEFANLLVERLNFTIKQAAARVGVAYVDVEQAFAGYGFCEDTKDPAMNGLTLGNDVASVIGNESYHPNAKGHQLYAEAIMKNTDGFSRPMPAPDASITTPSQEDDLLLLDRPKSNREIMDVNYDNDIANNVVYRDKWLDITYQSVENAFSPRSAVQVQLFSTPTHLGTTYANELGQVQARVIVPTTTPIGFHTLHLTGKNIQNKRIDTYKVVYVAHSEDDKNGDGITDTTQPCGAFEPSGQDADADGTDDACDAVISRRQPTTADPVRLTTNEDQRTRTQQPASTTSNTEITPSNTYNNATSTVVDDDHQGSPPVSSATPSTLGKSNTNKTVRRTATKETQNHYYLYVLDGFMAAGLVFTLLRRLRYARNK